MFLNDVYMSIFQYSLRHPMCKYISRISAVNRDSLKNTFWNRWCFWRHKPPCNQSDQRV